MNCKDDPDLYKTYIPVQRWKHVNQEMMLVSYSKCIIVVTRTKALMSGSDWIMIGKMFYPQLVNFYDLYELC